jgi:hypothetical protein
VDELLRASRAAPELGRRGIRGMPTIELHRLERLAIAYRWSSDLLDGAAPQESIDVAIAAVRGSKMKCILCPEYKDY